ncbi:4-amino-4-deoxychorismate lyase [Mycolicibacter terrae]|jgi:4-amino-4-deoxychorismate lyase|uniref:4-amino-4-deoxychorismate lyase n=1 Tax=Mycolicibacter terrae TaxID=1788 RepID=A0AAD1HTE1_9MYCO|nr:aminodeoxychorismate lyase [Mycolicibacter terrae]ORW90746.1 4-amino-4-deoxychorismate lyase [Mycolicibacter terrae]BBX21127.1 4-amino-4-deoxychorismate lyase [Mycolicibacter terrae]SNV91630.1 amino acid aminotransferase PabC [Mycolicibacter terrae]
MPADHAVTIVTLGGGLVDDSPLLHADDLAVLRGDGIFETLLVRDGAACLLDAHLQRLARSAELMDLPAPDLDGWRRAVDTAVRRWPASVEGALRMIYSRGRECGSGPTAYVMITPLSGRIAEARRRGVAVVSLDRGVPAQGPAMPWLLAGAKTLSYAVNMAALRHAAKQGADDVIFISSDGYVLEGPRSTVVLVEPGRMVTPPSSQPILRGTTAEALFEVARGAGYRCEYAPLRQADLLAAQDIWLVSSITLAARVHTLDGRVLNPRVPAAEVAALVDAAIGH